MTIRNVITSALPAVAMVVASCRRSEHTSERSGKPIVFVSVLPQAYLAERVAGGHVEVEVLVGPGQNPDQDVRRLDRPCQGQTIRLNPRDTRRSKAIGP
jgi:hypothetical protein